jgi:2-polyprenyl-3-methyl-5-hydroxy-6-metoxy-1,4-benzoquinol methylase
MNINDNSLRLEVSTPELDAAELEWWQKFSDIEERFCWVQTPDIQKFLRGHYLRQIIKLVPVNGTIVELGCGTGWLSILLAKLGAKRVIGIDFSSSQIEKAIQSAKMAGVADKVSFEIGNIIDIFDFNNKSIRYDVVIIHGFLHHLATSEIRKVLDISRLIVSSDGILIVWEPVKYDGEISEEDQKVLENFEALIQWLNTIPFLGKLRRIYSSKERHIRNLISQRDVGTPPRGVSPKEMPFSPKELPFLLSEHFQIQQRKKCLVFSHIVAQELLLMKLSHRFIPYILKWPILFKARQIEKKLLNSSGVLPNLWIFEMFMCRPK